MAKHEKYLLTVDAETGAPVKIEHMGEAGELTEVSLEGFQPAASFQPQIINVFIGSQVPAAPGDVLVQRGERGGRPTPPTCIFQGPKPPKPRAKPSDEDDD